MAKYRIPIRGILGCKHPTVAGSNPVSFTFCTPTNFFDYLILFFLNCNYINVRLKHYKDTRIFYLYLIINLPNITLHTAKTFMLILFDNTFQCIYLYKRKHNTTTQLNVNFDSLIHVQDVVGLFTSCCSSSSSLSSISNSLSSLGLDCSPSPSPSRSSSSSTSSANGVLTKLSS